MPGKHKRWRYAVAAAVMVGVLVCVTLMAFRTALHRIPDFYAKAVAIPAAEQHVAGEALERNILALHNSASDAGRWSATFTDEQINGWLAADLPEKFPDLLPAAICDPRVAFFPGQVQVACQYTGDRVSAVVSMALDVRLAEDPNTLAVRVRGARAGLLPLPLRDLLDQLTHAAQGADLVLRWAQADGDPVALIALPAAEDEETPRLILEQLEIRAGEIHLAGRTESRHSDLPSAPKADTLPFQ
jgi:hypothetical protein